MLEFRLSALALVVLCASGLNARAAWGSIHANNRSVGAEHAPSRAPSGEEHRNIQSAPPQRHEAPPARVPERAVEPHRAPEREVRVAPSHLEIERETRDRRRWDLDDERRHAYFWAGFYAGMPVVTLPPGYVTLYVGGNPYDYYDGVFYQPSQSGYVVTTPPIGAVVPALPPGAEPIVVGSTVYDYAGGGFYVQQPQGFVVVPPPIGVTVSYLPPGAVPVTLNGVLYYQADGVYFLPVMQDGSTAFTVVQP